LPAGTAGQVLKMNTGATAWEASTDAQGVTSVTGAQGITVATGTTTPVISLPTGTNGQVLKHNGTVWAAGTDSDTKDGGITTLTGVNGITASAVGNSGSIALPAGVTAQGVLVWNGSAWAPSTAVHGVNKTVHAVAHSAMVPGAYEVVAVAGMSVYDQCSAPAHNWMVVHARDGEISLINTAAVATSAEHTCNIVCLHAAD
jgi:hypothetical protein